MIDLRNYNHLYKNLVEFTKQFGYSLLEPVVETADEIEVTLLSKKFSKKICFSLSYYQDVERVVSYISVVCFPHQSINDFASFDEFLKKKKNIIVKGGIDVKDENFEEIRDFINQYISLFKEYGVELIENGNRFSGYYHDWTLDD